MSEKIDIWMPLYVKDYLAATSRLTTEQHGAYLLLIMDYWLNGPLPNDDDALAQIARLRTEVWTKHRPSIERLFKVTVSTWQHTRIDKELQNAKERRKQAVERGRAGARARWQDNKDRPSNEASIEQASNKQSNKDSSSPAHTPAPANLHLPAHSPAFTKPNANALVAGQSTDLPAKRKKAARKKPQTVDTWEAYSAAYKQRYGILPVRNARVNAQLAQFVQRVPIDEAPLVAAFYVQSNNRWYVSKGHDIGSLLADAEKLRTETVTGERMTAARAIKQDKTADKADMWQRLISHYENEERQHAG